MADTIRAGPACAIACARAGPIAWNYRSRPRPACATACARAGPGDGQRCRGRPRRRQSARLLADRPIGLATLREKISELFSTIFTPLHYCCQIAQPPSRGGSCARRVPINCHPIYSRKFAGLHFWPWIFPRQAFEIFSISNDSWEWQERLAPGEEHAKRGQTSAPQARGLGPCAYEAGRVESRTTSHGPYTSVTTCPPESVASTS